MATPCASKTRNHCDREARSFDSMPPPPIAIVSMSMRIPGGIQDSDSFWDLLINKKDARSPIPKDRFNVAGFYSPHQKPGSVNMTEGYFLNDIDLSQMDAGFFSMSQAEIERLDPQQRLLLEVVYETFESAGESNWRGKDIGCYVGTFAEDWYDLHAKDSQDFGMYRITGPGDFVLANRVSYEYDLRGPSMTVKVGCSSSMLCLHLACEALYKGDCSAAIVGGTNLVLTPVMTIAMCEQIALSPDASCKTFDANANGYARADAINAIYVKKLDDALRDGNPIRAVIRSTATNCDGKTPGIATPSSEAHEALIRRAYKVAGLDFSDTAMVECHGTGTPVGDPLEVNGIANVWGGSGVYIGSVKPNVGHSEGASGLTSIIKAVLSLENKIILPNIKFNTPNPKIPFRAACLSVPTEPTPWPSDRAERISVNSFGIGGANVHVIIDSPTSFRHDPEGKRHSPAETNGDIPSTTPSLLVFSANDSNSAQKVIQNIGNYYEQQRPSLHDLAYTLGARRQHLSYRAFSVTNGLVPFEVSSITHCAASQPPVFVFTGQGAQWPEMGKALMHDFPAFLHDLRSMDKTLSRLTPPPGWTIENELGHPENLGSLDQAVLSQPLCTAIQVALVNLLRAWGALPAAVVGHSSGEIAAAYAAGSLTQDEAITIAYYRGLVTQHQTRRGAMAAVGLGRKHVVPLLLPGLAIACENSASSVTVSGDEQALEKFLDAVRESAPDVLARRLRVNMAYHSHHMVEVGELYQSLIAKYVSPKTPTIPFYSSVTCKVITEAEKLGPSYWRQNLESPVLFYAAVTQLLQGPLHSNPHLEVGPHGALAGPLRQIYKERGSTTQYVSSLTRKTNPTTSLLSAMGQLYCLGVPLDFANIQPGITLGDVPKYPWLRDTRYWNESRAMKAWRLREFLHHDVLGSRVAEASDLEPTWRNILRVEEVSWIADHLVHTDIVYPAAGYIAIAGEAVRQLSGSSDYTLRDVTIGSALVLRPAKPTEIITTLRPAMLTDTLSSSWFDFSIVSYGSNGWTKNCSGQVRGGAASRYPVRNVSALPRHVESCRWYAAMKRVGLEYGPAFIGLSDITAGVVEKSASATVVDRRQEQESPYQLHPTTIDLIFQALSVAVFNGQPRDFDILNLPTSIKELYIGAGTCEELRIHVDTSVTPSQVVTGDGYGVAGGRLAFFLNGLKLSPLEDDDPEHDADPHAAVQLEWKPDIDLLDAGTLMSPARDVRSAHVLVERLSLACTIESSLQLKVTDSTLPHLKKYHIWLRRQVERIREGDSAFVADAADLLSLSSCKRCALIESLAAAAQDTAGAAIGTAIYRIFKSSQDIFVCCIDPLEMLLRDNILTDFYNFANLWDYTDLIHLLSHSKPNLRILEIGAGTGSITATILQHLTSSYGERMYSTYTYTDISAGFFVAAKERFKAYDGVKYVTLDITKDPIEQGFEAQSFDLIVAANVLHATPKLLESLRNVRVLLHPRGRLLLQELCPTSKFTNYVMGVLPGWWLGADDGRLSEPYVSPERWEKELRNAGFRDVEAARLDHEQPFQINANILAIPTEISAFPKNVTLLVRSSAVSQYAYQVKEVFESQGFLVGFCSLSQPPTGNDIISLLDLDGPFFDNISEQDLRNFLGFVSRLKESSILWLTQLCQIGAPDPRYAMVNGMSRTIRKELSVLFAVLELDDMGPPAWEATLKIFEKLQRRSMDKSSLDCDCEFVLVNGQVNIGRYHWLSVREELSRPPLETGLRSQKRLEIGRRGLLQTLQWVQQPYGDVATDKVEVEVRAAGMNFKDVLIAMGIVSGRPDEGNSLGCECAGVVHKIGANVQNVQVGDRVMLLGGGGSLGTSIQAPSRVCIKIPDHLSFEDAATMPCVYITVIRSLLDIGRLQKSQTVLIHSAAGGVGIAAIYICRYIGAEIYATVGTPEKALFLTETFGIAPSRIFNSRGTSFMNEVLAATEGRGVDLVLNSLSGELLHASWQCVAEYGLMVEIGKRDLIGRGKLRMDLFEANRGYFGVDVAQICAEQPAITTRLLETCMELYNSGAIMPIHPTRIFDALAVEDAFRFLQKGTHMGKVVIRFPENPESLPSVPSRRSFGFRPDVSYLLVGGLGGLGQAVATWMAERGAKHLIFLSRSAGVSDTHQEFLNELHALGCAAQIFAGSVANIEDVKKVVRDADKPITGVLQMSMVLRDKAFADISIDDWETVLAPKVKGTWNLHGVLGEHLDFFVLFSSFSGLIGQWGQANYSAANTFLDSFVQYRRQLGLAASVLDIGCMEDVGYISRNRSVLENFRASSIHTLRERDLLESLELIISRSAPPSPSAPPVVPTSATGFINQSQLAIGLRSTLPLADPTNRTVWKTDPRMAVYHNSENTSQAYMEAGNEDLRQFLTTISTDPTTLEIQANIDFLAHEIGITAYRFLMKPEDGLDVSATLAAVGVDSLIAIEIRNWWRQNLGTEVTVLEMLNGGSIRQLGELAAQRLKEKYNHSFPNSGKPNEAARETGDTYLVNKAL